VSLAWGAYRLAAPVLGGLAPAAGVFAPADERSLWSERLGRVRLEQPCDAWLHAASLGEATAVRPMVQELIRRAPGARLLLTATTATGRGRLQSFGSASLAPLDAPQLVRRFFDGTRPRLLMLFETELWPHWLLEARRRQVPVVVASARLSARSLSNYRSLGGGFRRLVGGLAAVLCQGQTDADRWLALGARADRTVVTGNLKNDSLPMPVADRAAARAALGLDPDRPLLVLGSVRPGEARILARAWRALPTELRAAWQVMVVPRHPRASLELKEEAADAGQSVSGERPLPAGAWGWDTRIGVLLGWYEAADVAFVGGSLRPYGGHNPLEPAACGSAILIGPHHANQLEGVRTLRQHGAVWVADTAGDLVRGLRALLSTPEARESRARAALAVVAGARGACARAAAQLSEWRLWPPS
jgi:3-deoxy-D-manno-octulosonic-acid transferase